MKIEVEIDQFDDLKLSRLAQRAGVSKEEAVRLLALHGPDFFLACKVAPTK